MKRLLLFVLIAGICAAFAPWHGNVQLSQCGSYIDGKTIGDTICQSTPGKILYYFDGATPQWQFDGTTAACSNYPAGNGHLSILYGIFGVSPCAAEIERCGNPGNTAQGGYTELIAPNTYVVLAFPSIVLGTGLCAPVYDAFQNATNRARDGNTFQEANDNALDGDTLHFLAPPGGNVTDWAFMGVATVNKNNLVINFDPGWKATGYETPVGGSGQGSVFVIGNAITLTGMELAGPLGEGDSLLRFTNGRSGDDLLDGVYLHGDSLGAVGGTGMLGAGRNVNGDGTITFINSTTEANGDCFDFGQYHLWYDGADRFTSGTTGKDQWQNVKALHGGCGGESMKSRSLDTEIGGTVPIAITINGITHTALRTRNIIAQLLVGDHGGQSIANGGGRVIDCPYAGICNINGNVIEQGPFTDNPDMVAYGRELCPPSTGELTPVPRRATNTLNIENNWLIFDTVASPPPSLGPVVIASLGSLFQDCATPFNPTVTFKNNTIVINNPNAIGVQMTSQGAAAAPTIIDAGGNIIYCGTTVYTSPLPSLTAQMPCSGGNGSGRIAAGLPPFSDSLASLPDTPPH